MASRHLFPAAFGAAVLGLAPTAAWATAPPLVLVTENGGVSSAAPGQHRLVIYADGTVITRDETGSIDPAEAVEIAEDVFRATRGDSNDECAEGLATSRIVARDGTSVRSMDFYGLGACDRKEAVSSLLLAAERTNLRRPERLSGPWIAHASPADGVPGATGRVRARVRPGSWLRVSSRSPRLVRSRGRRYLLTPRLLLPHEMGRRAPGATVFELRHRVRRGASTLLRAPSLRVTSDGRWVRKNDDGSWWTGLLGQDRLDRSLTRLTRLGYFDLRSRYRDRRLRRYAQTSLVVFGERRRSVTAAGLARGVGTGRYPVALAQSSSVLLSLHPESLEAYEPQAVRVAWRAMSRRAPTTLGSMPFRVRRRSGATTLVGYRAARIWSRYGERTLTGVARSGSRRYLLSVEPAL